MSAMQMDIRLAERKNIDTLILIDWGHIVFAQFLCLLIYKEL